MPAPWNRGLRRAFAERLFDKVRFSGSGDCWEFTGAWRSRFGYGRIRDSEGTCVQAHIAMYEMQVGDVPDGMWLLHQCDNPLCCNPSHLHPGTAGENRWDQFEHGAYSEPA